MTIMIGVLTVTIAGLFMGTVVWPMKLMRKFQFEHWWFLAMLVGLIITPWTITLLSFPNVFQKYADIPLFVLIKSNLFSISWGLANILGGLCFVRIGVALTTSDAGTQWTGVRIYQWGMERNNGNTSYTNVYCYRITDCCGRDYGVWKFIHKGLKRVKGDSIF